MVMNMTLIKVSRTESIYYNGMAVWKLYLTSVCGIISPTVEVRAFIDAFRFVALVIGLVSVNP